MARKPTDTIQLKVRMSETFRRQMEDAAARNGRSMNAEIVARLGHSIQKDQDAITELAKLLLDSVPDDVRHRMVQLMSQTAMEAAPDAVRRSVGLRLRSDAVGRGRPDTVKPAGSKELTDKVYDQRKDERKAGGKS
jgi:alkanesulfonate monooxygenase SsuD/methylene tetrahydromethanopterin reductase-like flavin-dependent oxidoreductase (luciferase family)